LVFGVALVLELANVRCGGGLLQSLLDLFCFGTAGRGLRNIWVWTPSILADVAQLLENLAHDHEEMALGFLKLSLLW
jgi:hypothetical protein